MCWTHLLATVTTMIVVLSLAGALCIRLAAAPLADAIVRIHESFRSS